MGVTTSKATPPPPPSPPLVATLKRTHDQRRKDESSSSSSSSDNHHRPLRRFVDLAFACQFVFRDDQTHERSLNPDFVVALFVDGWDVTTETTTDEYCLSGNVPLDSTYLNDYALSTAFNLDCHITARYDNDGMSLCNARALLQGDELGSGLPFGERTRHSSADVQWKFTMPMCHPGFGKEEVVYSLVLTVVPHSVSFYINRVELRLPRAFCELWFRRNALVQRQIANGIASSQ